AHPPRPHPALLTRTLQPARMRTRCKAGRAPHSMPWHARVARHEKGFYFENMYSTLTYKTTDDDVEKLSEQQTEEESVTAGVNWIAFKNQYFSSVLIAAAPMKNVAVKSEQLDEKSGYLKAYNAQMETTIDPTGAKATDFQYYFGPNNYRLLQSMDDFRITAEEYELQDLVYLGWPLFKWINRYFTLYVFDFFTRMNLPMGIVLLLITLLLRVIVYAPTRKSYMSSAKMRVLKPKVDEISKKYPKQEDAMKRQQEIMTLYSQYGVSPMGGCLPMLIQMPIWIAMFNFVPNAIELRQQSFLWADDLSTYDDLISWNFEIWGLGNHLSLFCLLFCACNLLYSYLMMRQQKETMSGEQAQQMKLMQWMMMLMPLFFFFMFNKYSAGLNYYYFISLLFSALTMWYLRKTTDDAKLLAKLEENYKANKNNPNKKPTGLAARLEALQKQQQEMLEQQRKRNGR
ncbi:MAG: membrane protein insertase YidC, partial [Bacteroidales bacterium]